MERKSFLKSLLLIAVSPGVIRDLKITPVTPIDTNLSSFLVGDIIMSQDGRMFRVNSTEGKGSLTLVTDRYNNKIHFTREDNLGELIGLCSAYQERA